MTPRRSTFRREAALSVANGDERWGGVSVVRLCHLTRTGAEPTTSAVNAGMVSATLVTVNDTVICRLTLAVTHKRVRHGDCIVFPWSS